MNVLARPYLIREAQTGRAVDFAVDEEPTVTSDRLNPALPQKRGLSDDDQINYTTHNNPRPQILNIGFFFGVYS